MKRKNKIMAAAALCAVVVTFSACKDDLGFGNVLTPAPSDAICFVTSGSIGASSEPFTRSAGYVDETVEEWTIEGTPSDTSATTRAAVKSSLYADFNPSAVRIFLYDDWDDSVQPNMQVPTAEQIAAGAVALPGAFSTDGVLSPLNPQTMAPYTILWNQTKTAYKDQTGSDGNFAKMRTYAMGPLTGIQRLCHDGTGTDGLTGAHMQFHGGDIGTPPYIVYTTPDEPKDQIDLIAAYSGEMTVADVYGQQVPLTFYHGLSAVQFKLDFDKTVRVTGLTITGVYKKGKCDIGENGNNVWDFASYTGEGTYTYTWPFNGSGDGYTEYTASDGHTENGVLTDGDETLLMIPQTLPAGAKVILEYQKEEGSENWVSKQITCDISGFQWKAGHRYIYTIKEEPSYSIFFDLAAGKVTINNTTYSGKVYVNGVATTVSGSHVASNKYYVYQSTGETTGEYDKNHTGWETAIGTGTCRIPNYPEVKSPDDETRSWADYVTDNSDADLVATKWVTCAESAKRKMVGGSKNFYIDINNITADVTLDNIYIDYTTVHTNAAIRVGGASGNAIFRLKGENKVNKIYNTHDNVRITITSYNGDKSSSGTLTVTSYNNLPLGPDDSELNRGRAMIGGGSGTQSTVDIKGGTIFVASPELPDKCSGWTGTCLGGGNTSTGYIYISGGRVTAVSHGNGAAIGGGAGFHGAGGAGYVYISGGEVYAYQFGASTNYVGSDSPEPVACTSTAIGGGSAFNNKSSLGHVEISGGYVYAQSIGGVAIGGATSMGSAGARGEITISGGTVIAKSLSGTIRNRWNNQEWHFDASTAIGGGSGGNEKRREGNTDNANGGEAIVNITGGTVIAGSVGGGKQGESSTGVKRLLGNATITMSGSPDVQAQMVMADTGGGSTPSFTMSGGKLHLVDDSYEFIRDNGGAVWMDKGSCTITGGTITNFKAQNGGAVYMEGGTFTMSGGTIQNCRAQYNSTAGVGGNGGAVYINDILGAATVNITGGTISGNYADYNGGAVYLEGGNVNMSGGTLTGNKALEKNQDDYGNGGGIYLMKGNYTMTGGTISGNTANRNGGGVFVSSPSASGNDITVDIRQGTITRNSSERFGAGLYVKPGGSNSATVNIGISGETSNTDPEITWNSASLRGGGIYVEGSKARLNMYEGLVKNNSVSAYVYNQDIANQNGEVTLALNSTTGLPIPDLYYITITFDPAGGDFDQGNTAGTTTKTYLVKSTDSKLNIPTPKRRNFTFKGWVPSQGEADTGHADSEYDNATGGSMTFNYDKDITLTATWQAN